MTVAGIGLRLGVLGVAIATGAALASFDDVDPETTRLGAELASFATAAAISVLAYRTDNLLSPVFLAGVPLSLGLTAGLANVTQIYSSWSHDDIVLAATVAAAPIVGMLAAGFVPSRIRADGPDGWELNPWRTTVVVAALAAVGAGILLYEFKLAGGPPLLQSNIDEARFDFAPSGLLHSFVECLLVAFFLATFALTRSRANFLRWQRTILITVVALAPPLLLLQGGRLPVLSSLLGSVVILLLFRRSRRARRAMLIALATLLALSSLFFVARAQLSPSEPLSRKVLYGNDTKNRSLARVAADGLAISLGEHQRTLLEVRRAKFRSEPFRHTVWFARQGLPRAEDPEEVALRATGFWVTMTYAGPLIMDFGIVGGILLGALMGFAAQRLYRTVILGRSLSSILMYAYLTGSIVMLFYFNSLLYFPHIWVGLVIALLTATIVRESHRPGLE